MNSQVCRVYRERSTFGKLRNPMTVWPNFDVVARVRDVYGAALEIVTNRPDSAPKGRK